MSNMEYNNKASTSFTSVVSRPSERITEFAGVSSGHMRDVMSHMSTGEIAAYAIDPSKAVGDNDLLAEIGYRPELRRHYSTIEVFGIAFSIMGLLPSIASTLGLAMAAGPVGMTWGWLCASVCIMSVGISMSELGSSIPTSGGLYYWTFHFAPEKCRTYLCFLVGYSNSLGLIGGVCSINYGFAEQVLSCAVIGSDGSFVITNGITYGVFAATMISHMVICSVASQHISRLQTASVISNISLILIFIIALPAKTAHRNDGAYIFGSLQNLSDWPTGWEFMLSWMSAIWTIGSFDSCVHMSEEATNASKAVPFGIISSIAMCGILGWVIMIVIAACMSQDLNSILDSPLGQPLAQIMYTNMGKQWSLAIMSLICVNQYLMGASILTAASRQIWAFSRDKGFPFSQYIRPVSTRLSVPVRAVWFGGVIGLALGCLCLIDTAAANALFSLAVAGNSLAWGMPVFCRMVWGKEKFRPGAFYTGKILSPIINWFCIIYITYVICMCMFPDTKAVEKDTMNYTVVINCGVWLLASLYYVVYAHKYFTGPRNTLNEETKGSIDPELMDGQVDSTIDTRTEWTGPYEKGHE